MRSITKVVIITSLYAIYFIIKFELNTVHFNV